MVIKKTPRLWGVDGYIETNYFRLYGDYWRRDPECGPHFSVSFEFGPQNEYWPWHKDLNPPSDTKGFRFIWHFHMNLRPFGISLYDRNDMLKDKK